MLLRVELGTGKGRQTKVKNLDRLAVPRDHQIMGLDVAMNEPLLMSMLKSLTDLPDVPAPDVDRQRLFSPLQTLMQAHAVDELHGQHHRLPFRLGVVQNHDIGVRQRADCFDLSLKSLPSGGMPKRLFFDDLDRLLAIDSSLKHFKDRAHSPLADH